MNWQATIVFTIGKLIQRLKCLRVEQADKIIKRRIRVWDAAEQRDLLFTEVGEVHLIDTGQASYLGKVECREANAGRYQNTLCGLACGLLEHLILLDGDVEWIAVLQILEQKVEGTLEGFIVFPHLGARYHFEYHGEGLLVLRGFADEVQHERLQQRRFRFRPKRVGFMGAFGRGVFD